MTAGLLLALSACGQGRDATLAGGTAARVSVDDFRQLRWIEGRWRGAEGAGSPFFEEYRFLDDSTIRSYDYPDSTLATASDSGVLLLRGDSVTSGGAVPRWIATRLDSVSVEFVAIGDPSRGFAWTFEGAGRWEARLRWDSAGVARERVYAMRALP